MSRNIFFISDTHFNHANVLGFTGLDGKPIRPEFSCVEHMDETMIELWNERVKPTDLVYHLGDVFFGDQEVFDAIMRRLNGRKRLILGNHDKLEMKLYRQHFEKIRSWRSFSSDVTGGIEFVACHYPVHYASFRYRPDSRKFCLHGHIHEKVIPEPGYLNVSVERTGYKPLALEEVLQLMAVSDVSQVAA